MTFVSDEGGNREQMIVKTRKVKSYEILKIPLLSGEGYLAKFEKL